MSTTFIPQNIAFLPWKEKKTFHTERLLEMHLKDGIKKVSSSFDFILNHLQYKENQHFISVTIQNVNLNNKTPDLLIHKITLSIQEALYPYVFSVDDFGKVQGLENFDQVKDRFIQVKKDLIKKYNGEAVDMAIEMFEGKLTSSHALFEELSKELFYSTLCTPVYRNYKKADAFKNETLTLPLFLAKQRIEVIGNIKLESQKENNLFAQFSGGTELSNQTVESLKKFFVFSENDEPLKLAATITTDLTQKPYQSQNSSILIQQSGEQIYKESINIRYIGTSQRNQMSQKNKKMTFFIDEK